MKVRRTRITVISHLAGSLFLAGYLLSTKAIMLPQSRKAAKFSNRRCICLETSRMNSETRFPETLAARVCNGGSLKIATTDRSIFNVLQRSRTNVVQLKVFSGKRAIDAGCNSE